MSKTITEARALLHDLVHEIHAPSNSVSIRLTEDRAGNTKLVVRIDPRFQMLRQRVPDRFKGYLTQIEVRRPGHALA